MELATLKGTEKQVSWAKTIWKDRLKVWQAAALDSFQDVETVVTAPGFRRSGPTRDTVTGDVVVDATLPF